MVKQRVVFLRVRLLFAVKVHLLYTINWPVELENDSLQQVRNCQSNKENSPWTKTVGGACCLLDIWCRVSVIFRIKGMDYECHCTDDNRQPNAILYNILRRTDNGPLYNNMNYTFAPHRCHCEMRRTVCLKTPGETCKTASDVLVKTINFMKSLPAFHQLPPKDQLALLQSCWAPLFILGLAQERVRFEVTDTTAGSMLKQILLNCHEDTDMQREQPTLAGVNMLKSCLKKFWSLDLSPKEYAYLKGTMIFNPGRYPHSFFHSQLTHIKLIISEFKALMMQTSYKELEYVNGFSIQVLMAIPSFWLTGSLFKQMFLTWKLLCSLRAYNSRPSMRWEKSFCRFIPTKRGALLAFSWPPPL